MIKPFIFKAKSYPPRRPPASGGLRFVVGKLRFAAKLD